MKTTPQFYLFLDVDGVLHRMTYSPGCQPRLTDDEQLLSRLPLLEETIRPYLLQLEISVSSTWRFQQRALRVLLDAMSDDVHARVIGGTPQGTRMHDCRPDEIWLWLKENGQSGVTTIVLDDHIPQGWRTEFAEWGSKLTSDSFIPGIWLKTDPEQAFGEREAAALAQILDGQA